jgi:hypothetical protein
MRLFLDVVAADQPEISVMNERGGLERLPEFFLGQPLRGESSQFVVDERQELLGGLRIALLDGEQDASDFVHRHRQN